MFSYIKAKNFKSLGNIDVNLTNSKGKKSKPKSMVILYGENGSGKSNFASVFYTLAETFRTMDIKDIVTKFLSNTEGNELSAQEIKRIKHHLRDTESIIKSSKTIGSTENMVLEYGFEIEGDKGSYLIEMDDHRIVREKLEFKIEKNKGCYYDIKKEGCKLNKKVFLDKEYYNETMKNINKFWGKHTLISILLYEISEKSDGYLTGVVNPNFIKVIDYLTSFSCRVKIGNKVERGKIGVHHDILRSLERGVIPLDQEDQIDKAKELLDELFTSLYVDIKEVYYKKEYRESEIEYDLYCKKLIANEIRDINFEMESTGTQQILELIPLIISAVEGHVVVMDEFDSGIHDLLVSNLLISLKESMKGQLILTTHNTMLMESNIDKGSLYFILVDGDGNKDIVCITDFEDRIHPNNNVRSRYLKGMYYGVPSVREIDFEDLVSILD